MSRLSDPYTPFGQPSSPPDATADVTVATGVGNGTASDLEPLGITTLGDLSTALIVHGSRAVAETLARTRQTLGWFLTHPVAPSFLCEQPYWKARAITPETVVAATAFIRLFGANDTSCASWVTPPPPAPTEESLCLTVAPNGVEWSQGLVANRAGARAESDNVFGLVFDDGALESDHLQPRTVLHAYTQPTTLTRTVDSYAPRFELTTSTGETRRADSTLIDQLCRDVGTPLADAPEPEDDPLERSDREVPSSVRARFRAHPDGNCPWLIDTGGPFALVVAPCVAADEAE
jgi:hypothetical protein